MDSIAILLGIVFFINLAFAAILTASRAGKNGAGYYAVSSFGTSIWVLTEFIFYVLPVDSLATQIAARALYLSGLIFAPFFLFFSFEFLRPSTQKHWFHNILWYFPAFILIFLIINTQYIVGDAIDTTGHNAIFTGPWYPAYVIAVATYFIGGFMNLLWEYWTHVKGSAERRQIEIIFLGLIPSIGAGMIFNVILPYFNNFTFFYVGPLLVVFFIGFTTIAILRYQIFNVKVIATNILVLILWSFLLTRTLLWENVRDLITDGTILVVSIPIGILLVRSVLKEVKIREHVEHLAEELAKANEQLTEMDRQKSEFVSIASHQLRSPLTAIKGYTSMILEGSYGEVSDKVRATLERVFQSSQTLVVVIENFLNLSRIEQGRMAYTMAPVDLRMLTQQVVEQLSPNASKKSLNLSYNYHPTEDPESKEAFTLTVDGEKIRQVLLNLLDNSIKYTPKGTVRVLLEKASPKGVRLSISDTGIGMSKATIERLFQKFSRADGAGKVNAGGAGLGLYLAGEIMKAHNGKVWAESEGEGKGSSFILELGTQ